VSVEPEHAALPGCAREPAERPQRDRVVAAQDERHETFVDRLRHELRDPLTGLLDLRKEPDTLVADGARLGNSRHDVTPVDTAPPELLDPRLEPRVADRRGAHVDAAAARAEVEWGTDHRDRIHRALSNHRGKASVA